MKMLRTVSYVGVMALLGACLGPMAAQAQRANSHARISAEQARAVALKRYHGRVEGPVKLENEEGAWQYSVLVRSGKTLREVMVDAHTGKIATVEVTSKAEEQREAQADAAKAHHSHSSHAPAHSGHKP
ncbi:MAG TPA: PepSY domain-containing protein [Chthonomonadaceae bacterium]|nr:PepSY domain-containing protein [Chthonomonadaceae bacterium]